MRTTRIMSFSVPPEIEMQIQNLAKKEHRTISEFLREAIRHYVAMRNLEDTRTIVSARLLKKGITEKDVEDAVKEQRDE